MEHDPENVSFIEAEFDEVVTRSQGAQLGNGVSAPEPFFDALEFVFQGVEFLFDTEPLSLDEVRRFPFVP